MRQVRKKGLLSAAAASGVFAMAAGVAHADSGAGGAAVGSPGVLSGNNVQIPVDVPVNVCGNTVDIVGALNPAFGNQCVNGTPGKGGGHGAHAGPSGAEAEGVAAGSPGVASGNNVQVPVDVPVNACGNSVNVVGVGNSTVGNGCANVPGPAKPEHPAPPEHPPAPEEPGPQTPPEQPVPEPPDDVPPPEDDGRPPAPPDRMPPPAERPQTQPVADDGGELAQTGAGPAAGAALPLGVGVLLGGVLLYRRARAVRQG